jgi:hypothetical protein
MRKAKAPAKRKPRKKRAKALRAAGVASLLLAGASGASADIPQGNLAAPFALSDEEIIEPGSLSTFTVDKENVRSLRLQQEVKNGSSSSAPRGSYCGSCYGCRSCRCYYCRSCRCTRA